MKNLQYIVPLLALLLAGCAGSSPGETGLNQQMANINQQMANAMLGSAPQSSQQQSMTSEPSWWTQKKIDCGLPSSLTYNDWVAEGSPCNASSSQSAQPAQTPSLASTLVGTWKNRDGGNDSLIIRPDLTATWLGDDGHIEVVSGDRFHFVYFVHGDQEYSDWKIIDNNTISHTDTMFGEPLLESKFQRQ